MNQKTARINQVPLQWSRSTLVSEVRLKPQIGGDPPKWWWQNGTPPMISNPVGEENCTPAPPNWIAVWVWKWLHPLINGHFKGVHQHRSGKYAWFPSENDLQMWSVPNLCEFIGGYSSNFGAQWIFIHISNLENCHAAMTLQPPALLVPAVSAPALRAVPVPRSCSGGRGVKRGAREPLDPLGDLNWNWERSERNGWGPNKRSFGVDGPLLE